MRNSESFNIIYLQNIGNINFLFAIILTIAQCNATLYYEPRGKGGENIEQGEIHTSEPFNIPVQNGEIPCRLSSMWDLPSKPGVYLFFDLRGTLYVGQTIDLQRRYEEHLVQKENGILSKLLRKPVGRTRFVWYEEQDSKKRNDLERHLIRLLTPAANRIQYRIK